jgi:O-antigen ligase
LDLTQMGRALFLAGIFLMVSGDWPQSITRTTRWIVPLQSLAWPWLYLTFLGASFVFLAASGVLRVARPIRTDFLHPSIALLAATFLLSVVFSQVPSLSWFAFGCFLAIVGFSLAVAQIVEDETSLDEASAVIAAAALFLAIRVIVWRFDEGLTTRASHIGNNAWLGKLQITWVLNLLAPLLLARFIEARAIAAAVLYGVAWLVSGAAIYVLFSRAGSFAFALTTLSLCALNPRYWRRWLTLLAVFMGLALVLIALSPAMLTYVVTSLIHFDLEAGIVMRQGVWRETAHMIVDHPLTGIGLGTYDDVAYLQYGPADPRFFRRGWHAHNTFLHILAETGAVGFLAWCYLWATIVCFLLRRWRDGDTRGRLNSTAALCVLLAFFVLSVTEALVAARVYASLRMNLTLGLLVIYGIRHASRT